MKSHVSMEAKVCPVCGEEWRTDAILLDRRLRQALDTTTVTGYDLCHECQSLYDQGYVALVEGSYKGHGATAKVHEPERTGRVMHMRLRVAQEIFSVPLEKDGKMVSMCFIDTEAFEKVMSMMPASEEEEEEEREVKDR